jgi:4-amino-4-deoxy-L-arabinose transferase-like glycosyltransferase
MLTFTTTPAMWAILRAIDDQEKYPRLWAFILAVCMGAGLLLKSLIGILFAAAAAVIWLALTRQLFSPKTWKRLHPFTGLLVILAVAAPWHVLAILRNPPYFDFTLRSVPASSGSSSSTSRFCAFSICATRGITTRFLRK